jgi:uridine monophosphate synthetase
LAGPGTIDGLREVGGHKNRGLLLVAQMSSKDNLLDENYTKKCVEMAEKNSDFVIGFIAQEKLTTNENFITMTPGVKIIQDGDDLGQQYNTPAYIIGEKKSDIIIVGRGIYEAKDPTAEAKKYQKQAWEARL